MLDKEQKKAYQREYMRQKRSNKKGLTKDENVRPNDQENVRPKEEYNALMTHLVDPIKRRKLQAIVDAFTNSPHGKKVTFGYHGANLDEVRQMLDLTANVV